MKPRRWLMALLALCCIVLQFPGQLLLSTLALAIWGGALALVDRAGLRRLWLPRFWLLTLLVALAGGVLLGQPDAQVGGLRLSAAGLEAAALMVLRGAFVFALAVWASRAVSPQDIRRAAERAHLGPLGAAVPAALELLPTLAQRMRQASARRGEARRTRGPWIHRLALELVCETAALAERLATEGETPVRRVAVLGAPGEGKTTAVRRVAERLAARGLLVGGVVQHAQEQQGRRVGYELEDLRSGERRPLARRVVPPSAGGLGFDFDDWAWGWARERIGAARREADVLVVDELGRLEARGAGHLPALEPGAGEQRARIWLLALRRDTAAAVLDRLGPPTEQQDAPLGPEQCDALAQRIVAWLGELRDSSPRQQGLAGADEESVR